MTYRMTKEEAVAHLKDWREVLLSGDKKAALDIAIEALIEALYETEWIPVSEKLPDKEELVLVTDNGNIEFGKLICGLFGDLWLIWVDDYWEEAMKVTAWMPLPEPYREGGGEK